MEIMLALIGSLFLVFASIMFYIHWTYKRGGTVVPGKIVGIEKYVSTSVSSRGRSSQLMYRPIYEFSYEGKHYWFYSGSKNTISHRIGQQVKLLQLPGGPEYVLPLKNIYALFSTVFGLAGIICWYIFLQSDHSIVFKSVGAFIVACVLVLAGWKIKQRFPQVDFMTELLKSNHLVSKKDFAGREVFWKQSSVDQEVARINKVGIIIALVFMALSGGLAHLCWTKMKPSVKSHLLEIGFEFSRWPELKDYFPGEGELIGFLIGIFFMLTACYSLVYSLNKR